jgi:radical SAM superfamily enzyme YgiQ (UPF0313 family)
MAKMLMVQIQRAPYIGTAYLCGAAKTNGHEFVLHMFINNKLLIQAVEHEKPNLIGFSCMSGLHNDAILLAREIKSHYSSIPIIMGGAHPTFFPEVIEDMSIDIICRGEGEYAIIELLDAFEHNPHAGLASVKHIQNLHVKLDGEVTKNPQRPLADPMDDLPMVDWSCYLGTEVLMSSPVTFPIRGCPYNCSYCFNESYKELYSGLGEPIRAFSAERALKEVENTIKYFAKNPVILNSDTFGTDIVWMERFLSGYDNLTDVPFVLFLRPELITEKVVSTLSKHNCCMVAFGVESGSERVRKDLLNRRYSNDLLVKAANLLHAAHIPFRTYNIIGLLSETEDEIWETININVVMKTAYPRAAIFSPMPGTKLTEVAIEQGYLGTGFSFDDLPNTILEKSILEGVDSDMIKNYLHFFQTAVIFPKLHGLIRRLVRVKPNPVFKAWFYFMYTHLHRKSEKRSIVSYIRYVYANRRYR